MPRANADPNAPLTFPGAETVTAPGADAPMIPTGDSLTDPNEPFLPSLTSGQFDGLFGTTTPAAVAAKPFATGGKAPTGAASGTAGAIVDFAKSLLGVPYVWGGTSSRGVDCSGLVYLAFKHAGITLPRVSYQQQNSGTRIGLNKAQAGDLIFWDENARNAGADHVAISLGGGWIIEAAHTGTNVRMRKLGPNEGNVWAERMRQN